MSLVDKYKFAVLLLGCSVYNVMASSKMDDFFPDKADNLTSIVWAHAVNNKSYLAETLNNNEIDMMEADIRMGKINKNDTDDIPIMSHTSDISDLSLEAFLTNVTDFNNNIPNHRKGVKLDFKETEVFEKSVAIVLKFVSKGYPIWLNADILPGPINSTTTPVDAKSFLEKAKGFSESTLSIGWTTNYTLNDAIGAGSYSDKHIEAMLKVINESKITQNITFPVRAVLAAESIDEMKKLLDNVPNSTLTIWQSSNETDAVDIEKLNKLISISGLNRTYIDVPEDLMKKLNLKNRGTTNLIPSMLFLITCLTIVLS